MKLTRFDIVIIILIIKNIVELQITKSNLNLVFLCAWIFIFMMRGWIENIKNIDRK